MPLFNCKIDFILTWSVNCVIVSTNVANQGTKFSITDTKLYVPLIILSNQDNKNCKAAPTFKIMLKKIV